MDEQMTQVCSSLKSQLLSNVIYSANKQWSELLLLQKNSYLESNKSFTYFIGITQLFFFFQLII
jgi:hypothetical protein